MLSDSTQIGRKGNACGCPLYDRAWGRIWHGERRKGYGVGVGEVVGVDAVALLTTIVIDLAVKLAALGSQALCEVTRTRWPTVSELKVKPVVPRSWKLV